MIVARAPYRICIAGGGTDRPEFYKKHGGFFISMAIDKYLYTTIKEDSIDKKIKLKYSQTEIVDKPEELEHERAALVLEELGVDSVEISSCGDLPSGTGMGSSGAYLNSLIAAVSAYKEKTTFVHPRKIAELSCHLEMDKLGYPAGKQDPYVSAYGGLRKFKVSKKGEVEKGLFDLDNSENLSKRLHLYYLNKTRDANEVLEDQKCNSVCKENSLLKIKDLAYYTEKLLKEQKYDEYGKSLDDYWQIKKSLSYLISYPEVEFVYGKAKSDHGVLGGKIIGAGGGGFLLLYKDGDMTDFDFFMKQAGFPRVDFSVDTSGTTVRKFY